jgi:hypothetical protein
MHDQDTRDVLNRKVDPAWADLLSSANPQPLEAKEGTPRSLVGSLALGFSVVSALCLLLAWATDDPDEILPTAPIVFAGLWFLAAVGALITGVGALFGRGPLDRKLGLIAVGWVALSIFGIFWL